MTLNRKIFEGKGGISDNRRWCRLALRTCKPFLLTVVSQYSVDDIGYRWTSIRIAGADRAVLGTAITAQSYDF